GYPGDPGIHFRQYRYSERMHALACGPARCLRQLCPLRPETDAQRPVRWASDHGIRLRSRRPFTLPVSFRCGDSVTRQVHAGSSGANHTTSSRDNRLLRSDEPAHDDEELPELEAKYRIASLCNYGGRDLTCDGLQSLA